MGGFFAELKRRQMFRVAAAYAVVAWLLLQVVNNVAPILDLPVWVARAFLLALVIGFPIALLFVWMRELAPADASVPKAATTKLDYVLAGGLILVIGLLSYQQLVPSRTTTPPNVSEADAATISIAVLPFENLSGDPAQKFFSDGMTEEITAALAKIRNLRIVGRMSPSTDTRDPSALQALGVAYLIGGSVRRDGERVRITAQLVKLGDSSNVWTESYDRQLTSIFATQEDVARAIADALRVPLRLEQGQSLVSNRTSDLESYQQYLRGRALLRARDIEGANTVLEGVVARDPSYAPAWALLARAYSLSISYGLAIVNSGSPEQQRRIRDTIYDKSADAARQAIRLDPRNPLGYVGLVSPEMVRGRRAEAEGLLQQALALDPNEPEVLERYSQFLLTSGRLKEALRLTEQLRTLEPFVPIYNVTAADVMRLTGQNELAIRTLEAVSSGGTEAGTARNLVLAQSYAAAKRYREAADTLLSIPANQNRVSRQSVEDAARILRTAPTTSPPNDLPTFGDDLNFVYAHVGAADRILDYPEQRLMIDGSVQGLAALWDPLIASLRKTQRFKALMRANGMVDYWRARGWPDFCRPVGADDFECE